MEYLAINLLVGTLRRETRNGRRYLVVSTSLIVPGVLPGSQGPIFYPAEENARNPSDWNGMPLVLGHPSHMGSYVSARDPDVTANYEVGRLYRVRTDKRGRLLGEAWIDELAANRVDKRIVQRLSQGKPIEVSTGLNLEMEPAPAGRAYGYIARNYRPDHVAILLDQKGACSLNDGCGLLVNESNWYVYAPALNAFCATGEGGGIDPTCSPGGTGGSERIAADYDRAASLSTEEHSQAMAAIDKASKSELQKALTEMKYKYSASDSRGKLAEAAKGRISARRDAALRMSLIHVTEEEIKPTEKEEQRARESTKKLLDRWIKEGRRDKARREGKSTENWHHYAPTLNVEGGECECDEEDCEECAETYNEDDIENVFCATGEGGGVDPTCSPGGGGDGGRDAAALFEPAATPYDPKIAEELKTRADAASRAGRALKKAITKEKKDREKAAKEIGKALKKQAETASRSSRILRGLRNRENAWQPVKGVEEWHSMPTSAAI